MQAFLKKQKKSQINNLSCHLKELEKEEQSKTKVSRRKEIIIREVINKIEIKKQQKKVNKTKSWFFERVNKINKEYDEQLYDNKLDNLEEMDKFLEIYSPPKLNQEGTDNLNRLITRSEIESITLLHCLLHY